MSSVKANEITKVFRFYNRPIDRLKELVFHKPFHHDFTALDRISFHLEKGTTFGVIGDNGAGKSTLLKILAGTLSPTRGSFEVNGVVSSLLELGSGFHPEMTGIENIFFYGSLLGIDHEVMKSRFDDIIAFSDLAEFIHYPVKTYSSGMYVRLAFSVATSVDPDILIIDEALAVGDQYFQKKCLERMNDFRQRGKTIIFCSHDLYQVKIFCGKTLWLDHGRVRMLGDSADVVHAYVGYEQMKEAESRMARDEAPAMLEGKAKSSFLFISGMTLTQDRPGALSITFSVDSHERFEGHIGWAILRKDKLKVSFMTTHMKYEPPVVFEGKKQIRIEVRNLNLVNGQYLVYAGVFDREAIKPIAADEMECTLITGHEILSYICHFDSTFIVG